MIWTTNLALTMGTLVVWGFLMAFLFNIFMRTVSAKTDNYLVWVSAIMFASYYFSDLFHDLSSGTEIYFTWFIYDLLTLLVVLFPLLFKRRLNLILKPASIYIFFGLIVNAILFLAMFIDMNLLGNREPWLLWSIYSFTVNAVDYAMIITLIIGRDWLGLIRLARYAYSRALKSEAKHEARTEQCAHIVLHA